MRHQFRFRPSRRFAAAATLFLVAALGQGCGRRDSPQSLLLVSVDTLRADHLGCHGSPEARTPVWDRLARRGLQFATTTSVAPFTLPSHASILTGDYPFQHRARRNGTRSFEPTGRTLAEVLQADGLRCAAFTAAVVLDETSGLDRGFEHFDAPGPGGREERSANQTVNAATRWLRDQPAADPWFLFVHLYDPHDPYEPRSPWDQVYPELPYDGEIAATDRSIGRLLRVLADGGRLDGALVVALSDHGESFGAHQETGHGFFLYEETLRVPMVMSGPPPFAGGRLDARPSRTIDVFPTLMAAFGQRGEAAGPGRSLLEDGAPPFEAYSETFHAALAYGASDLRSLQRGDWKYVRSPREELYNLRADPREVDNRLADEGNRASDFRDRMTDLLGEDLLRPAGLADEDPLDEARAEQLRALGYLATGRWEGAEDWRSLPDPKDFAGIPGLLDRAIPLADRGEWGEAVPLLEQVIAQDASNPDAVRLMARKGFADGGEEQGFGVYEAAVERSPERAGLWSFFGADLLKFHRAADALRALERSVALDGTVLATRRRLAEAAFACDRPERARREIEEILRRDPGNRAARALERRLR